MNCPQRLSRGQSLYQCEANFEYKPRRKPTLARKFEAVKRKTVTKRSRIPSVRRADATKYESLLMMENAVDYN